MLPRRYRLTHRGVTHTLKNGRAVHGANLSVRVAADAPEPGVAVVVPKRIAKKATDRNRLRRRLAAIVASCLPMGPGADAILVFAKVDTAARDSAALTAELRALLTRAGVTCDTPR